MKKLFKSFSVVCGLLALASCSENDMPQGLTAEQAAKGYDGLIVTVEELQGDDDATMRAAFGEGYVGSAFKRVVVWQPGDEIKLYGRKNWRTQLYEYDVDKSGEFSRQESAQPFAAFKMKEDSREQDEDYRKGDNAGYAVYPVTADNKFLDEERQQFQYKLENEINYSVTSDTEIEGTDNTLTDANIYATNIPMWGVPMARTGEASQVEFKYLTGFLRLNMIGLVADDTKTITVTADKKINGLFTTTEFAYDEYNQTTSIPELVTENTEEESEKLITVHFTAPTQGDYAVYIPIPAGNYASLKVEFDGTEVKYDMSKATNAKRVTLNEGVETDGLVGEDEIKAIEIVRGEFLTLQYKAEIDATESNILTLTDIANYIKQYGQSANNREYNVKLEGDGIAVGNMTENNADWCQIDYSGATLTNDVSLLLDFGFTSKNSSEDDKLEIIGGNNTTKLGIKLLDENTCAVAVDVNTSGNIVLEGEFEKTVTITKAKNVILKGKFADVKVVDAEVVDLSGVTEIKNVEVEKSTSFYVAIPVASAAINTDGPVTLAGATGKVEIAGNVTNLTLTGNYSMELSASISGEAKLSGNYDQNLTVDAQKITVNGTLDVKSNREVILTAPTINIDAQVYVHGTTTFTLGKAEGNLNNVVVAKGVQCKSGNWVVNANMEFNGERVATSDNQTLMTINRGTTTITENGKVGAEGKTGCKVVVNGGELVVAGPYLNTTIETNGGKVTVESDKFDSDITVNENVAIDVQAGHVGSITVADGKTATITTSGAATIGEIEGDGDYAITAYWTEKTNPVAENVNGGKIYTAAQLAALSAGTVPATVTLYADVKPETGKNIQWTPVDVKSDLEFNGGKHTIEGLSITKTDNRTGFFSYFANTANSVTVKDLTLKYTGISGTTRVGGLVGQAMAKAVNIENVKIEAEAGTIAGTTWVGGLIGATSGNTINVKASTVNVKKLAGEHSVGGLIGMIYGASTVTVTDAAEEVVKVARFDCTTEPAQANAGKFGMFVGIVYGADGKFILTPATGVKLAVKNTVKTSNTDNALYFNKQTIVESGYKFSFTGSTGNEIGYSPDVTDKAVKIGSDEFYNSSKTGGNNAKVANTINWFGTMEGPVQ